MLEAKKNIIEKNWEDFTFTERAFYLTKIADELEANTEKFAYFITEEIGKPLTQSIAEVEKSAGVCRHYAEKTGDYLKTEIIDCQYFTAEICYKPLGTIFSILPWNFPFWQVFRIAAPALMVGNKVQIKHAPIVPKCAQILSDLFQNILPSGVFQNIVIDDETQIQKEVENIIAKPEITMVTLTGSEKTGKIIASLAGNYLKKNLLELGGSDAFIVLKDADLNAAANALVISRFWNNGQACNGAKRAFIAPEIFDIFVEKLKNELEKLPFGNAMDKNTFFTHLARVDLTENLQKQVAKSIENGGNILYQKGVWDVENKKAPVLLLEVLTKNSNNLPILNEEVFGPVLPLIRLKTEDLTEICALANATNYGLAATIFTKNSEAISFFQRKLEVGFIAINKAVSSDARLPFGGIKNSGFGRELGEAGIKELCNIQTITVNKI